MRYAVLLFLVAIACALMLSCIATVTAHESLALQFHHAALISIFTVRPCPAEPGRWLVCRPVGSRYALDVVVSCPSRAAAEYECAWQQAEADRSCQGLLDDSRLRGVRA